MANDVKKAESKSSTEVAAATRNFYEKYGEAATQRNIIGRLLRLNKFGEYRAGQDEEEIKRGTALAAYMRSLAVGYVRWEDGKPAEIVMGPVGQGYVPPPRAALGHLDQSTWDTFDDGRPRDPWQLSNSLVLIDLETEELFTFSTSSKGGLGAIGELAKVYGKHIRIKPDEVPIIELDVGSYQHSNRAYGEIRFPVFKVVDWIPADRLPPLDGVPAGDDDDGPGGEPALVLPQPEAVPKPAVAKPGRGGFKI
jgi:hypothetical protein